MKYMDEALIFCDGESKPNPDIMVGAFLITDRENILKEPVENKFGESQWFTIFISIVIF